MKRVKAQPIGELLDQLFRSPDIAAKIAEGKATREEYAEKIALRQQWRDDINAAQAEIERIEALPEEEETPVSSGDVNGGNE